MTKDAKDASLSEEEKKTLMTTIAVSYHNRDLLNKLKLVSDRGLNDVVDRLLSGVADVYFDFILIDNELPLLHKAVFQLGEDPNSLYYFDGDETNSITIEDANKLMKQDFMKQDSCFPLTLEEAQFYGDCGTLPDPAERRIKRFLKKHKSD